MKAFKILFVFVFLLITGCFYVPRDDITIQGNVDIPDFDSFGVEIGKGFDPQTYSKEGVSLRYEGKKALRDEAIARIDYNSLNNGINTIRISVRDKSENVFYDYMYIYGNNQAITYPIQYSTFTLIKETPANLPESYYIIADYPQQQIEIPGNPGIGPLESTNSTEIRIPGSKIDIIGNIDKEVFSRYEIDHSYGSDNRIWSKQGVALTNFSKENLLGTLDLKELKYNGDLVIRLKAFKLNSETFTETVTIYVQSNLYSNLKFAEPSMVQNMGNKRVDGFLTISVDKNIGGANSPRSWVEYKKIKDNVPFTLFGKQNVVLTNVDLGNFAINEPGRYKANLIFDHNGEVESKSYEFEVIRRTEYNDYCIDGTTRKSCSTEQKSYYCDNSLQLIQNCEYCGCEEGICQENGACL